MTLNYAWLTSVTEKVSVMRIPEWTPEVQPQPTELIDAVLTHRGGQLIQRDRAPCCGA